MFALVVASRRWVLLAALLVDATLARGAFAAEKASGKTVAVGYFENRSEQPEWQPLAKGLADMLVTDLTGTPGLTVVERDRLQSLLAELELGKSKFVDPKTAPQLGKGLGASHVLVGSFQVLGAKLRVDARAVEVASGAVAFAAEHTGASDDVFAVEAALAEKLRSGLGVAPRAPRASATRVSVEDLRSYGKGLDALDDGRIDEARRILNALATQRPDFAEAKRGLDRLSSRIHEMLAASKLAPERVVALATDVAGGNKDACAPLFAELGAMQSATTQATTSILRPDGTSRDDLARILTTHYAVTSMLLEQKVLNEPVCQGNQSPAAAALAYFLFGLHTAAKQVMDCHPVALAQDPNRKFREGQCQRLLARVPNLTDARGSVLVEAADYPALMMQLGQVAIDRFPRSPLMPGLLPILEGYVEHAKIAALEGDAQTRAIAAAVATKARVRIAQDTAYADLALADVRVPIGERERQQSGASKASLTLLLSDGPVAMGTAAVELSVDGGTSFPHAWPLRDEPPGFAPPHLRLELDAGARAIVGVVDRRKAGKDSAPAIDVAAEKWFRKAAWLGEPWSTDELGRVRLRLVALDGKLLAHCPVVVDAEATERTRGLWLVARAACRAP